MFGVYSKKKKGYITGYELRNAMNSVGYNLNTCTLNMLGHRYADKKGFISFDDFIMCAIRLKTMTGLKFYVLYFIVFAVCTMKINGFKL